MDDLKRLALQARDKAYAPYSKFRVGAALRCSDGSVVSGCNVENASYGLCVCAERTAICAAVAQGQKQFSAIAIATASSPPSPPCGMCRQVLSEFCDDLPITLINPAGEERHTTLRQLLPSGFDHELLKTGVDTSDDAAEET